MNQETRIALGLIHLLEQRGHLAPTAHKDANLMAALEELVSMEMCDENKTWCKFIEWWGRIGHEPHKINPPPAFVKDDFWNCQKELCLSLVGTIADLSRPSLPFPPRAAGEATNVS